MAPLARTGIDVRDLRSRRLLPDLSEGAFRVERRIGDAVPIETPLSVAGLHPAVKRSLGDRLGLRAMAGALANGPDEAGKVKAAPIAPGSPIAALLMDGDIKIAAIGTVTMVEGKQVYGFGHPFLGWGHVEFPMFTASIINTLATPAGLLQARHRCARGRVHHPRSTHGDRGAARRHREDGALLDSPRR